MTSPRAAARKLGAIAGLAPALAIVLLFAASGGLARADEVAMALSALAVLSFAAGWLTGPFAVGQRWLAAVCVYGIAWIVILTGLALVQSAAESWLAHGFDAGNIALAVANRAAVAPISALYFFVPAIVLGAIWVVALRILSRLWSGGGRPAVDAGPGAHPEPIRPGRDPIRLAIGAAGIIAGYALVVAFMSAGAHEPDELGPPEAIPRPVLLAALLMVPAAVALVGALRRSGPILIAAGVLCLVQALVAFSGVTIAFAVPATLLLALGGEQRDRAPARTVIAGVLVAALGLGAWVAALAMTDTSCWVARTAADGSVVYAPIPIPQGAEFGANSGHVELEVAAGELGKGCGSQLTIQGAGVAGVLGIGAIAIASLGSMGTRPRMRPLDGPA